MAITDKLFETNSELEKIVEGAGKTIPEAGERTDIVSHLNYTLDLLKAMVSPETAAEADDKLASGYNGIQDKLDVVNFLLASGELPSGGGSDLDIEWFDAITPDQEVTFVEDSNPGGTFGKAIVDVDLSEIFGVDPSESPYAVQAKFARVLLVKVEYKETTFIAQVTEFMRYDTTIQGREGLYTATNFTKDVGIYGLQGSSRVIQSSGIIKLDDATMQSRVYDVGTVTGLSVKLCVFNY